MSSLPPSLPAATDISFGVELSKVCTWREDYTATDDHRRTFTASPLDVRTTDRRRTSLVQRDLSLAS
jgi:hypothetical protein